MQAYGYWDRKTRFIYGPGHFEMDSATRPLTPFYTLPTYEGQEPFAGISRAPELGVFLHYPEHIATHDLVPVYEGENTLNKEI